MTGNVFNIQHYSLHDGPGIRSTVFLKGCPMRCKWCANPESQEIFSQVYLDTAKCIKDSGCDYCEKICQKQAVKNGIFNHKACDNCGECAEICPSKAIGIYGKMMTVKQVLDEVESQSIFYEQGSGGITLSGGEPLMQSDFTIELLKEAKRRKIHTAVETCGYCNTNVLREAAGYLDYIFYDIKCIDADKHKKFTGCDNELILSNVNVLFEEYKDLHKHIRTPVIPEFNDTEEDIRQIKTFLKGRKNYTYELLPYHRYGEKKYELLGREIPDIPTKSRKEVNYENI